MKRAKPWYRQQTDSWYVTVEGVQTPLGVHPEGAPPPKRLKGGWNAPKQILEAFYKLMTESEMPARADLSVAKVCDLFLDFSQKNNDTRTYAWYLFYLQDFSDRLG